MPFLFLQYYLLSGRSMKLTRTNKKFRNNPFRKSIFAFDKEWRIEALYDWDNVIHRTRMSLFDRYREVKKCLITRSYFYENFENTWFYIKSKRSQKNKIYYSIRFHRELQSYKYYGMFLGERV